MTPMQPDSGRHTATSNFLDFTMFRRTVSLALSPTRLAIALAGVIATVALGNALDRVWPAASSPVVVHIDSGWMTEADIYETHSGSEDVRAAIDAAIAGGTEWRSQGAFETLLFELRVAEDKLIAGVVAIRPGQLLAALAGCMSVVAWLIAMHPLYAIFFGLGLAAIWGFAGVALARNITFTVATGDGLTLRESIEFARSRIADGFFIFLSPAIGLLAIAVVLWLFGLLGAIPYFGELGVAVAFPILIVGGAMMAAIIVLGTAALPMASSAVAVGDSDAIDALTICGSYVWQRPIKFIVYFVVAAILGVVAFALAKWLIALALWCGGSAVGATMNFGSPTLAENAAAQSVSKLDAIWNAPSPSGSVPFYGTFDQSKLSGTSWLASGIVRAWLMLLWGLLAAFAVCLLHASAGIAFLLLRRDVDRTDITEVAVEFADK